jgi:hypothetical protein
VYHGDFRASDEALAGAGSVARETIFRGEHPRAPTACRGASTLESPLSQRTRARIELARENGGPEQWARENNPNTRPTRMGDKRRGPVRLPFSAASVRVRHARRRA